MCNMHFLLLFFQGGSLFLFNYNKLGRLSSVILPTGEVLDLSSKITVDNDHLELGLTSPLHSPNTENTSDGKPFSLDVRTSNNDYKKYALTRGKTLVTGASIWINGCGKHATDWLDSLQVFLRTISSVIATARSSSTPAGTRAFVVWQKRSTHCCNCHCQPKRKCCRC